MLAEAPQARRAQLLRDFWSSWRLGEYSPAIDKRLYQSVQLMSHAEREEILRHLMAPGQTVESLPKTVPVPRIMDTLRDAVLKNEPSIEDASAELSIHFQRTLRVPVDDRKYLLPAGQGLFPLVSVDDYPQTTPDLWIKRGGIILPMYQSEALWIRFSATYPFAVKIGAGKINAVTGEPWNSALHEEPQDYLVVPGQPWLDGFSVGTGLIRQFVAMPLGASFSVEEQLTGQADSGGIQIQVYPMSAESYFRDQVAPSLPSAYKQIAEWGFEGFYPEATDFDDKPKISRSLMPHHNISAMGLGAGGKIRQDIYKDSDHFVDWDQTQTTRCFVHLCNSMVWRQITGRNPPHPPLTAEEYKEAGIPWFDYYRDDLKALDGSERLAGIKNVAQLWQEKNSQPLPENASITPDLIVQYGNARRPGEIREFLDSP